MAGPAAENHTQDVGFRFSRQRRAWPPGATPTSGPLAAAWLRWGFGCPVSDGGVGGAREAAGWAALSLPCSSSRCPEVALQCGGSGRQPVATAVSAGRGRERAGVRRDLEACRALIPLFPHPGRDWLPTLPAMGPSRSFLTGLSPVSSVDVRVFFPFSSGRPPLVGTGGVSGKISNLLLRRVFTERNSNFV